MPDERSPVSMKYILLSRLGDGANGRELTVEEQKIFAEKLDIAKRADISSSCHHSVFEIRLKNQCSIKPRSFRWVNRWKKVLFGRDVEWIFKSRLYPRGYSDVQGTDLFTRSPTAARTARRLLVSMASTTRWDLESIDVSTAFL